MIHKILPLNDKANTVLVANLKRNKVKYVALGSALIFKVDETLHDLDDVFLGCWVGYDANIEAERVTDYDRWYYYNHYKS